MSGAHGHGARGVEAIAAGHSAVHRLDPRVKIVALIALAIVASSTPAGAWAALVTYVVLAAVLVLAARLPLRYVASRMLIEVPFLLAAVVLIGTAADGGVRGGTLVLKLTASVLAMIVLSSTTPFPRLLRGFEALRTPRILVLIVSFMWRYLHVLGEEWHRMRVAREARGHRARWLWQERSLGPLLATLFLRSLSRGERVYLAMASRGFDGAVPSTIVAPLHLGTLDLVFLSGFAACLVIARVALA